MGEDRPEVEKQDKEIGNHTPLPEAKSSKQGIEEQLTEILSAEDDSAGGTRMEVLSLMAVLRKGPLPSPEDFEKYERVLPGAADRIMAMAEKEQERRNSRRDKQVEADVRDSGRGVVYAFVLGLSAIAGGIIVAIAASTLGGAVITLSGLASLTGTFIYGTRRKAESQAPQSRKTKD